MKKHKIANFFRKTWNFTKKIEKINEKQRKMDADGAKPKKISFYVKKNHVKSRSFLEKIKFYKNLLNFTVFRQVFENVRFSSDFHLKTARKNYFFSKNHEKPNNSSFFFQGHSRMYAGRVKELPEHADVWKYW